MTGRRSVEECVFWVFVYYTVFVSIFVIGVRFFFGEIGAAYHLINLTAFEWIATSLVAATVLLGLVWLATTVVSSSTRGLDYDNTPGGTDLCVCLHDVTRHAEDDDSCLDCDCLGWRDLP